DPQQSGIRSRHFAPRHIRCPPVPGETRLGWKQTHCCWAKCWRDSRSPASAFAARERVVPPSWRLPLTAAHGASFGHLFGLEQWSPEHNRAEAKAQAVSLAVARGRRGSVLKSASAGGEGYAAVVRCPRAQGVSSRDPPNSPANASASR